MKSDFNCKNFQLKDFFPFFTITCNVVHLTKVKKKYTQTHTYIYFGLIGFDSNTITNTRKQNCISGICLITEIVKGRPLSVTNNSIWAITKHLKGFPKYKLLEINT